MKHFFTITVLVILMFSSCTTPKEKAAKSFEDGIALSNDANSAMEKGDAKTAEDLHAKSIEKYKEAIQLDSLHDSARGAIAHAYFEMNQTKEAMDWYEQSNKLNGESATNYREMGLIKISLNELSEGQQYLDKAVALDLSTVNRDKTIAGLVKIGDKHFQSGVEEKKSGKVDEAKKHQEYAMSVLMLAYYYDNTRKDLAAKIAQYADEVGDYTVKMQYTKLSQQ